MRISTTSTFERHSDAKAQGASLTRLVTIQKKAGF